MPFFFLRDHWGMFILKFKTIVFVTILKNEKNEAAYTCIYINLVYEAR